MLPAIRLGDEIWLIFFDLETDSYVARHGVVSGVRGTKVQLRGMKGWHATAEHPPAFTTKDAADAWIVAHPRSTPTIRGGG